MKLVTTTFLLYLVPLTLAQKDYQDDYLGGKTEVEDDYVFLPGKNNNNNNKNKPQKDSSEVGSEGSGLGSDIFQAGNEEVIDNDDEDYSDFDNNKKFAGNSDDSGSGVGAESDDETIYDDLDESSKNGVGGGVGIFKPELKGKLMICKYKRSDGLLLLNLNFVKKSAFHKMKYTYKLFKTLFLQF